MEAIALSAGAGDAAKIPATNASGFLDFSLLPPRLKEQGPGAFTFQPGGVSDNGTLATWAEVQAVAAAATGPWTLFIDNSLAAAEVPAGSTTNFNFYCNIDFTNPQTGELTIKDTGLIQNIGSIRGAGIICESLTTHAIEMTSASRLVLREGGTIRTLAGTTVPALRWFGGFAVIASLEAGSLDNDANGQTIPVVDFVVDGGTYILAMIVNIQPSGSAFRPNCVQSGASSILLVLHDSCDRLGPQPAFLGFVVFNPIASSNNLVWANGNTASRPSFAAVGHMFYDTSLGIPIWYTGTIWIDAAGNPV